jgi:hypothetical protein
MAEQLPTEIDLKIAEELGKRVCQIAQKMSGSADK